jgi:hypothetical protein
VVLLGCVVPSVSIDIDPSSHFRMCALDLGGLKLKVGNRPRSSILTTHDGDPTESRPNCRSARWTMLATSGILR